MSTPNGTNVPHSLDSPNNPAFLSKSQKFGLKVEQWVIEQLVQRGYSPSIPADFFKEGCDAHVNGLCIEIKAAKRTKRKYVLASGEVKYYWRWQWSVHKTHRGEFALILVADTSKKRVVFIVPGSQVGDRTHLQITSHPEKYTGWLAQYRDKWSVIDYLAAEVYQGNGPLFEEWDQRERVAA